MKQILLIFLLPLLWRTQANVLFRINFDFSIKDGDNAADDEATSSTAAPMLLDSTTRGPTSMDGKDWPAVWAQQRQLSADMDEQLSAVASALRGVQAALQPLSGSWSALLELEHDTGELLDKLQALSDRDDRQSIEKYELLNAFVLLVDQLERRWAEAATVTSLEQAYMRLLLEKYKIFELKTAVELQVLAVKVAWEQYVRTKLVEVAI